MARRRSSGIGEERRAVAAAVSEYAERYAQALAQLRREEPGWSAARRRKVARSMVDALLSGRLSPIGRS